MKFASGLVLSVGLLTAVAHAESFATLSHIQGEVLVNTGKGFAPVESMGQVSLKRGDRILVRDQAVASLSFPDCSITLDQPTTLTVTDKAPCAGAALPGQAIVVTPTSADSVAGEAQVVGMALSAAIVIGAGVVLVDGLTDDDKPASPN